MKKLLQIICALLLSYTSVAQQEKGIYGANNWLNNWTEFKPVKKDYNEPNVILAGNISTDTKLLKKNTYSLQGNVYVTNNAVLSIEPGTLIIGDFDSKATLIITKGASIIADGLDTDPIVFTSNRGLRKAGDWGGIVIIGDAPINKYGGYASVNFDLDPSLTSYGGTNTSSNSGILRHVRIEFAGKKIRRGGSFSSLLLAGVGNKTILENIMVSYSGEDSFEILGGDPKMSKLVSYRSNNVDFRFSQGTQSTLDNSLAIRSSYLTSGEGSRCMNIASYENKDETDFSKKQTLVTASNITMLNDSENVVADIKSGLIKEAVYIEENASFACSKTVISGFNPAVILDSKIEVIDANLRKIVFENMYFNLCKGNIFSENNPDNSDLESWYGNTSFFNVYADTENGETFLDFLNSRTPDYRLGLSKITIASPKK
jgi:hypothetical protein